MDLKVEGLEGVNAALAELKKGSRKAAIRRVLKAALEPVAATASELAPVDEGTLRASITVGTRLSRRARGGAPKDSPTQTSVFCGTANRNAVPREFGTSRSAAQPFLRPAWDRHKGEVLNHITENMAAEIERTAERAARRAARKTT